MSACVWTFLQHYSVIYEQWTLKKPFSVRFVQHSSTAHQLRCSLLSSTSCSFVVPSSCWRRPSWTDCKALTRVVKWVKRSPNMRVVPFRSIQFGTDNLSATRENENITFHALFLSCCSVWEFTSRVCSLIASQRYCLVLAEWYRICCTWTALDEQPCTRYIVYNICHVPLRASDCFCCGFQPKTGFAITLNLIGRVCGLFVCVCIFVVHTWTCFVFCVPTGCCSVCWTTILCMHGCDCCGDVVG